MIFIRDKLTYEEVKRRFEEENYILLSTEYKNAKSHLNVLCPRGHDWTTSISNFISIQWKGYNLLLKHYQGEILIKEKILKKYYKLLDNINQDPEFYKDHDWSGVDSILREIFKAFD